MDEPARSASSTFGQFALAAATMVLLLWDLLVKLFKRTEVSDVDLLADDLARAMRVQWEHAAADRRLLLPAPLPIRWQRCTAAVAGPLAAAVAPRGGHARFAPLPGLTAVTAARLRSGDRRALHRVHGGLASGRLILVGGPGSGKSSAAVLLLLDALNHRDSVEADERRRVPVPVMFTLSGWDPEATPLERWLVAKFCELRSLRLTEAQASALLHARKIAVFLDGLDEVPARLRPAMLRALSDQGYFRLVLLTRTKELVAATEEETLAGAVALELSPLRPTDVADYLFRTLTDPPPAPWQAVIRAVTETPESAFAGALSTPLTVSLLRDIYGAAGSSVDELLDADRFREPVAVVNHLLDQVVDAAYARRPGDPPRRYTAASARHALAFVARRLAKRATRDLTWWDVTDWVPLALRLLLTGTLLGLAAAGAFAVTLGVDDVLYGLLMGAGVAGTSTLLRRGLLNGPLMLPRVVLRRFVDVRTVLGALGAGVLVGVLLIVVVVLGLPYMRFATAMPFGVAMGGAVTVLTWLGLALTGQAMPRDHPVEPETVLREDKWAASVPALMIGLVLAAAALGGGVVGYSQGDFGYALDGVADSALRAGAQGAVFGVVAAVALSQGFQLAIVQACLAVRYRTPLRLTRFLQDAHSRHLLRAVGPVYQFRHATLQDRLAGPAAQEPARTP